MVFLHKTEEGFSIVAPHGFNANSREASCNDALGNVGQVQVIAFVLNSLLLHGHHLAHPVEITAAPLRCVTAVRVVEFLGLLLFRLLFINHLLNVGFIQIVCFILNLHYEVPL